MVLSSSGVSFLGVENSWIILLKLSYNYQNQVQINAVLVQQEKVDRVEGFEPTTSANYQPFYPAFYQSY